MAKEVSLQEEEQQKEVVKKKIQDVIKHLDKYKVTGINLFKTSIIFGITTPTKDIITNALIESVKRISNVEFLGVTITKNKELKALFQIYI